MVLVLDRIYVLPMDLFKIHVLLHCISDLVTILPYLKFQYVPKAVWTLLRTKLKLISADTLEFSFFSVNAV